MKIALIDCLSIGDGKRRFSRDFIGGGPKQIAGLLSMKFGKQVVCKIFRAEQFLFSKSLEKEVCSFDVCMISAMSMDEKGVDKIIDKWKKFQKNGLIIIGGPISNDSSLIEKMKVDVSIYGEAEKQIIELFDFLLKKNITSFSKGNLNDLLKIQGINFSLYGKIYSNSPAARLNKQEYNNLTIPSYIFPYISQYPNYQGARIYVECLRGCSNYHRSKFPIKGSRECIQECNQCREGKYSKRINCPADIPPGCGFCSTIKSFGYPKSRKKSHIISEIQGILQLGGKRIVLGGSDFLDYQRESLINQDELTSPRIPPYPNYKSLKGLINQLVAIPDISQRKAQLFIENVKASLCTNKALEIVAQMPNPVLSIGCETGSERFSRELGRPNGPEEVIKAVERCTKYKIRVHIYFIHDLPGEQPEYLRESIELIKRFFNMGVEKITIYRYRDLPGAPFYKLSNKNKYIKSKNKILNKIRKKLVKTAINFNRQRKFEMLGKEYLALAAEKSNYNEKDAIFYIIQGGPKVLLKNFSGKMGNIYRIKISKVLSDKLVEGEII